MLNAKQSIQKKTITDNLPGGIAIVMDIGGTKIKLGLVADNKILCTTSIEAQSSKGLTSMLPVIENLVNGMLRKNNIHANEISGVGISIPGIVDSVQKKILSIDNKFNDVVDINLSDWIYNTWQTKLEIENDARCALIGEWQFGKGKGYDNVVLMTIGTGIGSSAVIEGKILRGKHSQAGCFGGHFTVNLNGAKM